MKRRFTILTAALALLTFLAVPMGMWGQTRTNQTAFYGFETGDTGWTSTSFVTNNTAITAHGGSKYGATNGSTATLKYNNIVDSPQSLTCYVSKTTNNTTTSTWYIQVSSNGTTWTNVSSQSATSMSKGEWVEFTADLSSYSDVYIQIKYDGTSAVRALDDITLIYDDGTTPSTDPEITFTPSSITLDEVMVGNEVSTTFSVGQANLTSDIALSVDNGSLSTSSIAQGAAATTVTWTYTPTTAGAISATVTATSGTATETLAISGTAIAPVEGYDVDFEYATDMYPNWTFNNMTTYQTGSITAHGGTYYGTTGGKATASITTKSTVANPGTLTCYVSKQSGNTTSSTWYIQVSENGSTWTDVESHSATSMSQGSWVEFTADLTEYTDVYVRVYYSGSTAIRNIDDLTLTTVDPSSDPSITAADVNIDYDAEEGTINYTINNPVEGGSLVASCDAEWIEVDDTPQTDAEGSIDFLCAPNSNFYAHSATVTLTYTYGDSKATVTKDITVTQALDPDANGSTAEYPIMVSEAIEAIDEVSTVSNIYVGGVVSNIVTEYSSQYDNITFDMIDEEGDEYFVRAYRCVSTDDVDASEVAVGDYVIVKGNLMLYNSSNGSIYELAQGCQLFSLIHPAVPSIAVSPESVELDAEEGEGAMDITYENLTITAASDFDIQYYNEQGVEISEPDWILADVNEKVLSKDDATYEVTYTIEANNGPARTAYFKVYAMDDETNLVYSNLVTISQAAASQQYTLTVEPFENLELITFVNDEMVMEGDGEIQVTEGNQIMLSIVALEGYVMETLMVNGVNHVNDIAADYTYSFDMPAGNVIISATAVEDVPPTPGDKYVKVTSTADLTSGQYLIVYEDGSLAFDGSLETLDAASNTIEVTINDSEIGIDNITIASEFTIDVTTGTIMSASGYYIGQTSNANGMQTSLETAYTNTISFDESGNANIVSSGGAYLRYNSASNQNRFRYYKSSSYTAQKAIQLYKKVATYTLENITGYTGEKDHYFLIASPVTVDPANVEGMTTGDFDLYYFDQAQEDEWRNYEVTPFNLVPGTGYLYAKEATTENPTYSFELTGTPYAGNGTIDLDYDANAEFPGFNLIGNPFGTNANLDLPYYRLNSDGSALNTTTESTQVLVMEGVFVQATSGIRTATFSSAAKRVSQLNVKVTRDRSAVLDNAIIRFDNGAVLGKFQLNPNSTKLYITEGNQDYAVVRSNNAGEMPVSFKAAENGIYTLSIEAENVEASYLHLIDNMTGIDVDLLATPSYSFEARTTDYANRFRLEFNTNGVEENNTTANFAYFNGSSWTVNNMGEATLQVVDMMGRVISTETISGNTEVNLNQAAGVYMLRLVTGNDVKVQKVVVR